MNMFKKIKQNKKVENKGLVQQPYEYRQEHGPTLAYGVPSVQQSTVFGSGYYGPATVQYASPVYRQPSVVDHRAMSFGSSQSPRLVGLDSATMVNIDSHVTSVSVHQSQRPSVVKRQLVKVPGPNGRLQQLVRRLPQPEPDLIERVFYVKPQRDIVDIQIIRPPTPPPKFKERTVYERQEKPLVNYQVVRVPSRPTGSRAPKVAFPSVVSRIVFNDL
jgi:hypothetical protein